MRRVLVVIIAVIGFVLLPGVVQAADMYLILDKNQVAEQGTFTGTVYVSTGGLPINSAEGTLHFPTDLVNVESVSNASSIFNIWVEQPSFSNPAGKVYFNGGLPTPGYSGQSGQVIRVNFRAKKSGSATLSLGSAAVRANDGKGTDVLGRASGAVITIGATPAPAPATPAPKPEASTPEDDQTSVPRAPVITSADFSDQNAWYNKTSGTFSWGVPANVTAVQLVLGSSPSSVPYVLYDTPIRSKAIPNLVEGVWYLNARFKNANGWGKIASRKIQVDITKPTSLSVKPVVAPDGMVTLSLSAKDALSGVQNYSAYNGETKLGEILAAAGQTDLKFGPLSAGNYTIAVRAYDKAGNYIEEKISIAAAEIVAPRITEYPESIKTGSPFMIQGQLPDGVSAVTLWVQEAGQDATSHALTPDSAGVFIYSSDQVKNAGTVTVWAEANGVSSEKVAIRVIEPARAKVDMAVVQTTAIGVVLLVGLLLLVWLLYVVIKKLSAYRKGNTHTDQELYRVFEIIKGNTKQHIRMLEKASAKRKLTKEEKVILAELSDDLDEAEEYLLERVKSIGNRR